MKKHTLLVIMLLAAVVFATSCSKEEKDNYPEGKLIGAWKIPLIVELEDGTGHVISGKSLLIYPNHTAYLHDIFFNYWKLEGDVLTFTRDYVHDYNNHEVGEMKVTVADLTDTTMVIVGKYIHAVNDIIDKKGEVSGMYYRISSVLPQNS